jgi:hypothetical protein
MRRVLLMLTVTSFLARHAAAQLVVFDPANLIEAVAIAEQAQRHYQELMAQYRTIVRMSQGLGSLEGYRVPAIAPSRHDLAPWSVGRPWLAAFNAGEMECDGVAVVRFQGPRANGMPELHKLTTPLAVLQGKGFKVALVTDGRMSGASGKVPAAIHVSPEALAGGPLAKVRDGDLIRLDADAGTLQALVDAATWSAREAATVPAEEAEAHGHDLGRELFAGMRRNVKSAEEGAITWM